MCAMFIIAMNSYEMLQAKMLLQPQDSSSHMNKFLMGAVLRGKMREDPIATADFIGSSERDKVVECYTKKVNELKTIDDKLKKWIDNLDEGNEKRNLIGLHKQGNHADTQTALTGALQTDDCRRVAITDFLDCQKIGTY